MLTEDYGTVKYEGKTLTLTQIAYADKDFTRQEEIVDEHGYASLINPVVYFAKAVDFSGNEYEIKWKIINYDCEDESDACDWTKFEVRELFSTPILSWGFEYRVEEYGKCGQWESCPSYVDVHFEGTKEEAEKAWTKARKYMKLCEFTDEPEEMELIESGDIEYEFRVVCLDDE